MNEPGPGNRSLDDDREVAPLAGQPRAVRRGLLSAATLIAQRLAFGILVLLAIILLSYLGLEMAGGASLGPAGSMAFSKTVTYVSHLLHGNLGLTLAGSDTALPRPVGEVLVERLPASLGLLGIALVLAALVGSALGILAALGRARRSLGILLVTLIGISVPSFFAAFLLQWALTTVTRLRGKALLPVGGFGWDAHLVLPVLVLSARPIAQITRIAFISVRHVLDQDYVRTAQGKGLRRTRIMAVHVLRNAAIPILTTIGVSLRFCLSSLPVVEYYFNWPGAGFTLLKGIAQRDDNLTVALLLCLGLLFILVNLALELGYRIIDPRLLQPSGHVALGERRSPWDVITSIWTALRDLLLHNALVERLRQHRRAAQQDRRPARSTAQAPVQTADMARAARRIAAGRAIRNFPLALGSVLVLGLAALILFGPQLAPRDPSHTQGLLRIGSQFVSPPFAPSTEYHWGTDAIGRDLLSMILGGARQTLMLGILAVAARAAVGLVLGAIAGWTSGSVLDRLILSLAEVIAAFPTLLLAMTLILALGIRRGMPPFILALCFAGWGEIMQFVRGEVIAIRPKTYIESAVAVGARSSRIIIHHILPNLLSALISIISLEMGAVLMLLGELGFISIFIGGGTVMARIPGVRVLYSDVPEWGAMLSSARYLARSYPWTALYPMLAFFVSIASFNLFGEGIRRMIEDGNLIVRRLINRYALALALIVGIGLPWLNANNGSMPFYTRLARTFDGARALDHVEVLADPAMYGRALGSPGMRMAAQYIADQFKTLGLQAAGQEGTYFQERARTFEQLDAIPSLQIEDGGPDPAYGQDYTVYPGPYTTDGEARSPVRLIALGKPIATQSGLWRVTYADLYGASFPGEILLTLSEREASLLGRMRMDGLLVVAEDPTLLERRETFGGRPAGETPPRLLISEAMAERLLAGSGYNVQSLRDHYAEMPAESVLQVPLQVRAQVGVEGTVEEKWPVQHVIGYIPGTHGYDFCADCLGKQLIVVLAQYDGPPIGPNGIVYPAANDNASGVAVMLEAIRVIQETGYQPYKTLLFVAYSAEGLEGGETVLEPDVARFLQARPGMSKYVMEAIVYLRGVGAGTGKRLEISASGSLRLAELIESAARRTGTRTVRTNEAMDIGVIYNEGSSTAQSGPGVPSVRLYWEGWESLSHLPADTEEAVSADRLQRAGRALALSLMVLGRERVY